MCVWPWIENYTTLNCEIALGPWIETETDIVKYDRRITVKFQNNSNSQPEKISERSEDERCGRPRPPPPSHQLQARELRGLGVLRPPPTSALHGGPDGPG